MKIGDFVYRFEDGWCDEPFLNIFKVEKLTPCGFHISWYPGTKWISNSGKKRFVYPTIKEASYAYYRRKLKQVEILTKKLKNC